MPSSKFAYYKVGTLDKQIFVVTVGLNIKSDYATLVLVLPLILVRFLFAQCFVSLFL